VKRQLLEETRHVFLIARKAVETLRHDDVELLLPGVVQQRLIVRPQMRRPAGAVIRVDALERPALRLDPPAAHPHLVLDRGVPLEVRRISGVDDGAHVADPGCFLHVTAVFYER
jgi:hypothetical protein